MPTCHKVLIVDDNLTNLKLMKIILSLEGYEIKTAINAQETLEIIPEFNPILILMDLQLPGMDGLELTRQIKNNAKYRDIIIIAVTAYAMPGDKKKSLDAGCDGYIPKPINPQTLPQIVAEYINY